MAGELMQDQGGLMGLLTSPMGQGLLAAGLGAMGSRGNTMQAIGRGGLLGLSTFGQAQETQQNKLIEAAKRKAQQDALAALTPGQDGVVNASPATLMAAGFSDPAKWDSIRNMGRDKVKQLEKVTNADGSQGVHAISEYGGVSNTGLTNAPEIKTQDLGGQVVGMNPYTGQQGWAADKLATISELEAARSNKVREGLTVRGQNMTDARAREKNVIDQNAVGKVEWKQGVDGEWVALPKELSGHGPVSPVTTTMPGKRESQSRNALGIIDEAGQLIDKATGSYLGAGVDAVARTFGASPQSAQAAAQLRALEGALMMAQPRMEGPQSDKDVALYRQMAGQIGDSTVPAANKKAALDVVKRLHSRYAGSGQPPQGSGGASGSWGAPATQAPAASGWGIQRVN